MRAATRSPGTAELDPSIQKRAGLDRRCMTGRAICISKRTRKLVWVVDSTPKLRMDVRFGSMEAPTREGSFMVTRKSRHQVSSLYHTHRCRMPCSSAVARRSTTQLARLKQIGWFQGRVSGTYGSLTTKSVKGFQAKRKIPATGEVDQRTLEPRFMIAGPALSRG